MSDPCLQMVVDIPLTTAKEVIAAAGWKATEIEQQMVVTVVTDEHMGAIGASGGEVSQGRAVASAGVDAFEGLHHVTE